MRDESQRGGIVKTFREVRPQVEGGGVNHLGTGLNFCVFYLSTNNQPTRTATTILPAAVKCYPQHTAPSFFIQDLMIASAHPTPGVT